MTPRSTKNRITSILINRLGAKIAPRLASFGKAQHRERAVMLNAKKNGYDLAIELEREQIAEFDLGAVHHQAFVKLAVGWLAQRILGACSGMTGGLLVIKCRIGAGDVVLTDGASKAGGRFLLPEPPCLI